MYFARDFIMSSTAGWGQSENFRMINSGWGQTPTSSSSEFRSNVAARMDPPVFSYLSTENYSGPVETWTNYKAISPDEWKLFKEHMIVYSDGTNVDGVEAGWLVCMLCTSKKAQSKDLIHSHILSMKHQRNFDWVRSTGGSVEEERVAPVAYYTDPPLSAEDKELLQEHRLSMVDGWIQCTLCVKKLMDMSFVPEHIRTTKHLNNLEWVREEERSSSEQLPWGIETRNFGEFYCTNCSVAMSSRAIMNAHVASIRHIRNGNSRSEPTETFVQRAGVPIVDLIDFSPERKATVSREIPYPPVITLDRPKPQMSDVARFDRPHSHKSDIPPPPSDRPYATRGRPPTSAPPVLTDLIDI